MRKGSALVAAGIVTVVAGLAGPGIAAEDTAPPPEAAVEETGTPQAPLEEATGPALDSEEGRAPTETPTEEIGDDEAEREHGRGERDGGRDEGTRESKQPLANIDVKMKDIEFKPKSVTISPGDEVTWKNLDTAQHDARADDGSFETPLLEKGETAQVPFNASGTFAYVCSVHPSMTGKVVVRSSGSGGDGGGGDSSSGDVGGAGGTGGSTFDGTTGTGSAGSPGTFSSGGSSGSAGGGSLPNTGGVELPLLLFGSALIVIGLLARAFHEYWIWR